MSEDRNESVRGDLRRRATRAVVADAVLRWESAVTIALTMLLVFFVPVLPGLAFWQSWMWLVLGAFAELALVIAHVTDPKSASQAVARLLEERYNPRDIKNRVARQQLERALEYRAGIEQVVGEHSGAMRTHLQQTLSEIDDWIGHIYRLSRRMDDYETNPLIEEDLRKVPQEIVALQNRLRVEKSARVQQELQEAIHTKEQQMKNLQAVADNIKRADIQLSNTLGALGTVFAQVKNIDTRDLDRSRTRRLQDEIHDQVAELEDTIYSMDEVYSSDRLRA